MVDVWDRETDGVREDWANNETWLVVICRQISTCFFFFSLDFDGLSVVSGNVLGCVFTPFIRRDTNIHTKTTTHLHIHILEAHTHIHMLRECTNKMFLWRHIYFLPENIESSTNTKIPNHTPTST